LTRSSERTESAETLPAAAEAAIRIESTPAGAAITLGGEPTGLVTPATLRGLSTPEVSVGLALPGYEHRAETIAVPASWTVTKRFELVRQR
jgi:hypothetical protein